MCHLLCRRRIAAQQDHTVTFPYMLRHLIVAGSREPTRARSGVWSPYWLPAQFEVTRADNEELVTVLGNALNWSRYWFKCGLK